MLALQDVIACRSLWLGEDGGGRGWLTFRLCPTPLAFFDPNCRRSMVIRDEWLGTPQTFLPTSHTHHGHNSYRGFTVETKAGSPRIRVLAFLILTSYSNPACSEGRNKASKTE